jgi:hypothetical protein
MVGTSVCLTREESYADLLHFQVSGFLSMLFWVQQRISVLVDNQNAELVPS